MAIEDDDRIHLTTNLVGCEIDDVEIGMRLQVRCEHDDDVWIPVFEPTGGSSPGPQMPTWVPSFDITARSRAAARSRSRRT